MVRLLAEAGASTMKETKHDKKTAIQFAASSRHSVSETQFCAKSVCACFRVEDSAGAKITIFIANPCYQAAISVVNSSSQN